MLFQLGYGGASPLLSDRRRFPRWFRLVSPDTRYNLVRVALARAFGWKRLATINPALDYFSAVRFLRKAVQAIYRYFFVVKMKISTGFFFIFFLFLLINLDCGYTLEPPRQGGSNEYPQIRKNRYTPANPSFTI